jgi:hypothetical protein
MIRCAAAVVLALTLVPMRAAAQDTVLTVTEASADVYKAPTTASPMIGHVSRGTVLPVERNLGSWVKVQWPDGPDGVGYVHVTMGRIGKPDASLRDRKTSAATHSEAAPTKPAPSNASPLPVKHIAPRDEPQSHAIGRAVGIGGVAGSMSSFGASARAWRTKRVGVQVAFTRDAMTSATDPGRVTSWQVEPGVVYKLFDRVSDYVWVRPYVGSAVSFRHQTLTPVAASPASASDDGLGFRVFGGSELTWSGVTQFALFVDVGYRRIPTAFAGFEPGALSISIGGHWYIK